MTILKLLYKPVSSKTGKLKTTLRKHRKFSIPQYGIFFKTNETTGAVLISHFQLQFTTLESPNTVKAYI